MQSIAHFSAILGLNQRSFGFLGLRFLLALPREPSPGITTVEVNKLVSIVPDKRSRLADID